VQCGQVAQAQFRRQETGVPAEIRAAHGRQVEGERHAADQAHGAGESLAVGAFEERAVRRAEDRPLVPEFFVGQVGVHATAA